ncbi:MAG: chemotaxis protein CheB, partial [Proteobacteria bacterium]|nr:chemotaxis protein CheB [Pseudomonadota bacterium]
MENHHPPKDYKTVVIGVSAGGMEALSIILPVLPKEFSMAVVVVQHQKEGSGDYLISHLNEKSALTVQEAKEKHPVLPGNIYMAPSGYHLLIERDFTFSLSMEERVNYSRPSIDVLFETASDAYQDQLIGVILTGANSDGALGLKKIRENGGLSVVQEPESAFSNAMPTSAITVAGADHILSLDK